MHNNNLKYLPIFVIGRPNVGKTSWINSISGSNLKVGNFTGATATIDGVILRHKEFIIEFFDTPGIYTLGSNFELKQICKKFDQYIILHVVDTRRFDAEIPLMQEILDNFPSSNIIFCFNCNDGAIKNGIEFNFDTLAQNIDIKFIINECCQKCKANSQNILNTITEIYKNNTSHNNFNVAKIKEYITINKKNITNINQKIDTILLNKFLSLPIFALVIFTIFKITFFISSESNTIIRKIVASTVLFAQNNFGVNFFTSLLNDGIIQGIAGIMQFVPSIAVLFFAIEILESSGYMSRISFIMNAFMKLFGLNGRAVIPFVTGLGCSIPAYLSTRIMPNNIQRIATMFAIGFMTCSAKFLFFVMLVGSIFSPTYAPYVMLGIYIFSTIVGLLVALITGKILQKTMTHNKNLFIIEMHDYKIPDFAYILKSIYKKIYHFLANIGTTILYVSVIFWFLANYSIGINGMHSASIENSIIGVIGRFVSPIFTPIGFDWRMNITLLSGLMGKEVGIVSMILMYGSAESVILPPNSMSTQSCLAFITFFMFYLPCISATTTFAKEVKSAKLTIYLILSTSIIAWFFAFIVFNIANLIY